MRIAHVFTGLSLAIMAFPGLANPISIEHTGVGCVIAERFPRFEAKLNPTEALAAARLYFRSADSPWYFVSMTPENGSHWATLPKPTKELKGFDYYIETTDKSMEATRTREFSTIVVPNEHACSDMPLAPATATATVTVSLATAQAGAAVVPTGFASTGVVAPSAVGAGATGGGLSAKTLAIAGGLAAGAGAAIVVAGGGGGGLDFSGLNTARFDPTSVTCPDGSTGAPLTVTILMDVTNNGDSFRISSDGVLTLTTTAVSGPPSLGGRGPGSEVVGLQGPNTVEPPQVPAKATAVIRLISRPLCRNPTDASGWVEYDGLFFLQVPEPEDDTRAVYTVNTTNRLRVNYP